MNCQVGLPWWLGWYRISLQCERLPAGSNPGSGRSPGEGNGNPLKYSHHGNPMDRGAWQATVHGAAKSQTWPSNQSSQIEADGQGKGGSTDPYLWHCWRWTQIHCLKKNNTEQRISIQYRKMSSLPLPWLLCVISMGLNKAVSPTWMQSLQL